MKPELLDRELGWIEFNRRVLHEAIDPRTPLLERVRFLAIFESNLDEFFMKRVGGIKRQALAGIASAPARLAMIREALLPLLRQKSDFVRDELIPALARENIALVAYEDLTSDERARADRFFFEQVFPVLTPLSVDPGHPFPFISNLSTSFGLLLKHPGYEDEHLFARIKVPDIFPDWIQVQEPNSDNRFRMVSLNEMICHHLDQLFPGLDVEHIMMFRLTRNADIERDEEGADDLLAMVAEELKERRFADAVRLELGRNATPEILEILRGELEVGPDDIYEHPDLLEHSCLKSIADLPRHDLKYPVWNGVVPDAFQDAETSIFDVIRRRDVLVHHPYESFTASVERFIRSAVEDPKVIAIKMTLYRTGSDSPFIPLLIRAAESGKQVACLVELQARFDEEKNIQVAQALEKAGVHVVYGIVGLKTHSKIALVIRREDAEVRSYVHIGTGNYHAGTARLYTDLGLFTAKTEFTRDVIHLFHYLTGRSNFQEYQKLMVAPLNLRERFLAKIDREIGNHREGRPARIIAKMNALEDENICQALYLAAQAGVTIDLLVRGFCRLKPGVAGLSESVRVTSTIGRFLEHSRIFHFANGHADPLDGEFFIGSCDWMSRNLQDRVEAVAPIEDLALKQQCWSILTTMLADRRQAWRMNSDGSYARIAGSKDIASEVGPHEAFMTHARNSLIARV